MSKRRKLDREGLEVYFLNLLLAYRPLLQIGGVLILVYAVISISVSSTVSVIAFVFAIFIFLVTFSYQFALIIAKIGAWIGTLWRS